MKPYLQIVLFVLYGITAAGSLSATENTSPPANSLTHSNTTCQNAMAITSGTSQYLQIQPNGSQAWYSFVATEPDFTVAIHQFNGHQEVYASMGRFTVSVFGPFSQCDNPCAPASCNRLLQRMNSYSNISWDINQLFESIEIHAHELNSPVNAPSCGYPFQTPAQFIIMIEASFETNLPTAVVWNFDLYGASCCWPEEQAPAEQAFNCENFYHLGNGINQVLLLPAQSSGLNEVWLGITTPAGYQLPASVLELFYNVSGNEDGCNLAATELDTEVYRYGPFDSCDEPCNQIAEIPDPNLSAYANTNSSGNFLIGNFSQPLADVEQLWLFRLVFNVACTPCALVFEYDLTGGINGFSNTNSMVAPCMDCLPVQGLLPEKKYIITAWVHDPDLPISSETITDAEIRVVFNAGTVFGGDAQPSGPIIDGWQQIECEFTTPT
ncbi:MAG: hypothetical protein ACK52I_13070, partial [Pseudomonadota bacterium]